jgi:uncharacterized coiled-coil protein SlyX
VANLVTTPYSNAHKTLAEVNQDVMKDQLIVQDAAAMLRTVTDRLYQLGELARSLPKIRYPNFSPLPDDHADDHAPSNSVQT